MKPDTFILIRAKRLLLRVAHKASNSCQMIFLITVRLALRLHYLLLAWRPSDGLEHSSMATERKTWSLSGLGRSSIHLAQFRAQSSSFLVTVRYSTVCSTQLFIGSTLRKEKHQRLLERDSFTSTQVFHSFRDHQMNTAEYKASLFYWPCLSTWLSSFAFLEKFYGHAITLGQNSHLETSVLRYRVICSVRFSDLPDEYFQPTEFILALKNVVQETGVSGR